MRVLYLANLLIVLLCVVFAQEKPFYTDTPVIGILTQVLSKSDDNFPNRQYLASSYVKWIESAGGRVIPIPMNLPQDQAFDLLTQINGLLMPGGATYISKEVRDMITIIISLNQKGIHFPIWSTCMGFQWMAIYFSKLARDDILDTYNSYNVSYALEFEPEAGNTTLIQNTPKFILDILSDKEQNVTLNNHNWGVSMDNFSTYLADKFYLISSNVDEDGKRFVSTMEHRVYPFYGVQWHPEKNAFELGSYPNGQMYEATKHTMNAILASQYMANFFVNEARKNSQTFRNPAELHAKLIYNYSPTKAGMDFLQRYYFDQFVYV